MLILPDIKAGAIVAETPTGVGRLVEPFGEQTVAGLHLHRRRSRRSRGGGS